MLQKHIFYFRAKLKNCAGTRDKLDRDIEHEKIVAAIISAKRPLQITLSILCYDK